MIVVAIISILAVIAVGEYQRAYREAACRKNKYAPQCSASAQPAADEITINGVRYRREN